MNDIHYISANKANVIQGLTKRGFPHATEAVEELLAINQQRKAAQLEADNAAAALKQYAKKIGQLMQKGKDEEATASKLATTALKLSIKKLTQDLQEHETALQRALYALPNLPHANVPEQGTRDPSATRHTSRTVHNRLHCPCAHRVRELCWFSGLL